MTKKITHKDGVPTLSFETEADVHGYDLVDVRRPDEFTGELGHIKGAKLVTIGLDLEVYLESADKARPTLFICRSGMRSANATMYATQLGFKEVYNMEGGMMLWNQLGLATEK
jgi:rhodanese-related sulfurtransferase